MADVIAEMDRLGIGGGVLSKAPRDITPPFVHGTKTGETVLRETCERLAEIQAEYPGRFVTQVGIDPRLGYEAAKHVRIAVREYGIKCVRIIPMFTGIAIDDKLAYPLYTAACDEGAVVSINVGVPGPMKPAKLQRTILVDEVALAFPELAIVMSHLGDPWISETIAMLIKHPNVYAMTAGWAPKYVPEEVVRFAERRNPRKLMWASDYPILPFDRTVTEGRALALTGESSHRLPGWQRAARSSDRPRLNEEKGFSWDCTTDASLSITGAAGGIGREHALEFARQGAKVVVNDVGPAQDVVDEIVAAGGEAVANSDDISDWDGAGRLVATALDTFGDLHVLVNNAGILRDKMFVNMDIDMWDAVIRVHLRGTFAPTKHAVAYWRERHKAGTIRWRIRGWSTRRRRRVCTATRANPITAQPKPPSPPSPSSSPTNSPGWGSPSTRSRRAH